jgi:hypothetical protein
MLHHMRAPRVRYDQTLGDLRQAVSAKLGVPADKQQLFFHKQELLPADDARTLLEMNMHTGFALKGYDLVGALAGAMLHGLSVPGSARPHRPCHATHTCHGWPMSEPASMLP